MYQVYPRSFADCDGDGIGDLPGVIGRLGYLADLGVDAIWLTPFYPSPLNDGGYDVSDYTGVDPRLGTLADFDALVRGAAERGIRVIVDLVPNHCSSEHPLFAKALAAAPGSAERALFLFRDGRGPGGGQPPNNWPSRFGGRAWTRVPDGQWYLHLFDSSQPDWNWRDPRIAPMFEEILRFWLDRGVGGFRVDVAHGLFKDADLADVADATLTNRPSGYYHRDETQDVYRSWRRLLDSYPAGGFPGRGSRSARSGRTGTTRSGPTCSRAGCRRCSTSSWSRAAGRRRGCARRSTRPTRSPTGRAPPGCSATTMWTARSPAGARGRRARRRAAAARTTRLRLHLPGRGTGTSRK